MTKPWYKQRTTWSAVGMISAAGLVYMRVKGVDPALLDFLEKGFGGAALIFLRQARSGGDAQ